jgi:predicted peptidase
MSVPRRLVTILAAMAASLASGVGYAQPATQSPATPTAAAPAAPADDPVPSKPGTHRLAVQATVDGQTLRIPYVLYVPDNFQPDGKCPVLVFLHGLGERGTDLDSIFTHGPNFELIKPEREDFRRSFPFIVISPQCPPRGQRWDDNVMPSYLHATLDHVLPKIAHDADRVYLTGFSMGGLATWKVAGVNPARFAALLPISAQPWPAVAGAPLKQLSTLAIVGDGDNVAITGSHAMADGINAVGGTAQVIQGPGGHGVWVPCYANPQVYEWLLVQRRQHPTAPTPPAMSANLKPAAGFQQRSIPVELAGERLSMNCQVYVPASLKPGDKAPAIVFLHDDRTIGIEHDGMIYHGPAAELLRPEGRKDFPFILISPQLPPLIGHWDDPAILTAVEKAVDDGMASLPIDRKRVYVVGQNMGARGATLLVQRKPAYYAAELAVMTHPRVAIGDLRGDWLGKQRIQLVLTEKFEPGRTDQLQEFIKAAAPGSTLTVLPPDGNHPANPFASREPYDWLLK